MTATAPPVNDNPVKDEQDSPWKQILRQYLEDAMVFFFPAIADAVDWRVPPVFLDKEFRQIAPEAKTGRRFADQLVQLQCKRGKPLILLLHIEIQASPEANFAERVFVYALRIFDYFRQPATSIAILGDANPRWRPSQYTFSQPETDLIFRFGTVKLLDYKLRWADLEASTNPFACVVMAHLKMQETKQDKAARKVWKLWLIRRLYESGYNQDDVVNLFHFIDWLLKLPKALEDEFWQDLQTYEQERTMPYITSVERIGRRIGREEGREEERRSLVTLLLNEKFGDLPESTQTQITALSLKKLEALAIALLKFQSIDELNQWLQVL
jgi:Domain of unknown function (DUF4351)